MSIQMQFLQTTLNTQQSFSISGGRGIVINILTIKFILLTNILIIFVLKSEYCVQVLSLFLRCFLAETLHVFNVFLSETLAKYANVQGNVMTFTTKTLSTSETDWVGRGTMTPVLRSQRTAPSGRGTPGFHRGYPQNR